LLSGDEFEEPDVGFEDSIQGQNTESQWHRSSRAIDHGG